MKRLTYAQLGPELIFTASRSSGAGGQNVNKVNTRVTLRWNIQTSRIASGEQKETIIRKLKSRLTNDGDLVISCQETRSQLQNRDLVIQKLESLLIATFTKPKVRKASKPGKAAIKKRLESKKIHSDKKKLRKRID